ncbi:MAG: S1C family serine protease [Verrucomicrobiota bacterium]
MKSWRASAAGWLLAMALAMPLSPARAQSPAPSVLREEDATPAFPSPPMPRPVAVSREELPAAFTKPAPASLEDLRVMQRHVEGLVARVSPAVVAVEVGYGSGSGVVITGDGLVLTAGHVCGWPRRDVLFTFADGKNARGKTLGVDDDNDTGLMRITDPGPWPHAETGDLKQAALGDWTLALGHPGGFDLKRSLVVRLGRIVRMMPGVLQTDCTLSPGDSGGPLFDMFGRVIGIHTAISSSVAENFHVPVTEFYDSWSQLATGKTPDFPAARPLAYAGATAVDDAAGCRLSAIEKNGPAFKAGLKVGDLVLKIEGRKILLAATFNRWVAESGPGEVLSVEIKRGARLLTVDMKLQSEPDGN